MGAPERYRHSRRLVSLSGVMESMDASENVIAERREGGLLGQGVNESGTSALLPPGDIVQLRFILVMFKP